MAEITLGDDGARALQEAESFCWQANIGIVAPEHLLAGALAVLGAAGLAGMPTPEALKSALLDVQGAGDTPLTQQVMFGSAARAAMTLTARAVAEAGGSVIDARVLALGAIASDEVMPSFYAALGTTKEALVEALS